jgi:predicted nucleotidyltransferase component of viral defense system
MNKDKIMPMSSAELNTVVAKFIQTAHQNKVRMIMVGGGAVNFHGVQRHSADIDFWIDCSEENLNNLNIALNQLGFETTDFPKAVHEQKQNISIHISPVFKIELITYLNFGISFDEAYFKSESSHLNNQPDCKFNVLTYDHLIESKLKAGRPKDYYDVLSLRELKEKQDKRNQ